MACCDGRMNFWKVDYFWLIASILCVVEGQNLTTTTSWLSGISTGNPLSSASISNTTSWLIGSGNLSSTAATIVTTNSQITSVNTNTTSSVLTTTLPTTPRTFQPNDELLFVTAIWRHGQRNPVEFFDGDINKASDFPEGIGEMTLTGLEQLFQVGERLRSRYVTLFQLLSSRYYSNQIYIESTDVNRTLISAQCVAQGLYSAGSTAGVDFPENQRWPSHFVPIPIHSDPVHDDIQLPYYFTCPRKDELWKMVQTSSTMNDLQNFSAPLLQEINDNLGKNLTLSTAIGIMDAINAEYLLGRPIVSWAQDLVDDFAYVVASYTGTLLGFSLQTSNTSTIDLQKQLGILLTGGLLNEVVGRFIQRANCELYNSTDPFCSQATTRRFYGYSGHDMTLLSMFRALGFNLTNGDEEIVPGYGSCLMMELWQRNDFDPSSNSSLNGHYLKLLYMKNSTTGEITDLSPQLSICANGKCPLSAIAQRAADLKPNPDVRKLCSVPVVSSSITNQKFVFVSLLLAVVVN